MTLGPSLAGPRAPYVPAAGIWIKHRLYFLSFSFQKIKTSSSYLTSWSRGRMDDQAPADPAPGPDVP